LYPALLPLMRTPLLPVVDWNDAPADLNGLVRFAERRTLVSARVPSHFKQSLQLGVTQRNSAFCYTVCFILYSSQYISTICLNMINRLVFVMDNNNIVSEAGTSFIHPIKFRSTLFLIKAMYFIFYFWNSVYL